MRFWKPRQYHHLINQALLSGNTPHPFIVIAKAKGINIITASWNKVKMPHQGGHTNLYYSQVRTKVDAVYREYLRSGRSWKAERIEKELRRVASDIHEGIKNGSIKLYRE